MKLLPLLLFIACTRTNQSVTYLPPTVSDYRIMWFLDTVSLINESWECPGVRRWEDIIPVKYGYIDSAGKYVGEPLINNEPHIGNIRKWNHLYIRRYFIYEEKL